MSESIYKYYFEPGAGLHQLCPGRETALLEEVQTFCGVTVTGRDNCLQLAGAAANVEQATAFFDALKKLFALRRQELDAREVELLWRTFRRRPETGTTAELERLWQHRLRVSPRKKAVLPRSEKQLEYIEQIRRCDVVFGIGPAGTGKTYLAMACAVESFLKQEVNRIILTRPARESGERLGFLPGSLEDKVSPYLRPLYDALYEMLSEDEAAGLIERNLIEVAPLAFMRGRTLNGSFIILDEAQNTTEEQMLMLLTRLGFGSKCVITGDPDQSDLPVKADSGLQRAIRKLQGIPEIGFCRFDTKDVVRHRLLEKIILSYNQQE